MRRTAVGGTFQEALVMIAEESRGFVRETLFSSFTDFPLKFFLSYLSRFRVVLPREKLQRSQRDYVASLFVRFSFHADTTSLLLQPLQPERNKSLARVSFYQDAIESMNEYTRYTRRLNGARRYRVDERGLCLVRVLWNRIFSRLLRCIG